MTQPVGSVYVEVRPSTQGFVERMERELLAEANKLGAQIGNNAANSIGKTIGKVIGDSITGGVEQAGRKVEDQGKRQGGAFARAFRDQVARALKSLPEVDLKADPSSVAGAVAQIRTQLEGLADKTVGVDLRGAQAITQVRALRAELLALRDRAITVELDFDLDQAIDDLGRLEAEMDKRGGRSAGAFADSFRSALSSALQALPSIDLGEVVTLDGEALGDIRAQIEGLLRISDVELRLDAEGAIGEAMRLRAALEAVRDEATSFGDRFNAQQGIDQLTAFIERIDQLQPKVEEAEREAGAFAKAYRSALQDALSSLRELESTTTGGRLLGRLREQIRDALTVDDVELGLDPSRALAGIAAIHTGLESLRDRETVEVNVKFEADRAARGLGEFLDGFDELTPKVEEAEREVGSFARTVRKSLADALSALPEIDIGKTSDKFARELGRIRDLVARDAQLTVGVDLDGAAAIAGAQVLVDALDELRANPSVSLDIRHNADVAVAALTTLDGVVSKLDGQVAEVKVEPNFGAFAEKARATVQAAAKALPSLPIRADASPAQREIVALRERLVALGNVRVGVDMDSKEFNRQLTDIRSKLAALGAATTDVTIRADTASAITALDGLDASAKVSLGSLNQLQRIALLTLAAFPLVAAAILGVSAVALAAAAPIAAIALGMDGIRAAAAPLANALVNVKAQVSAAFEAGLAPAVEKATRLLPTLTAGLVGSAQAASQLATAVVDVATSGNNLDRISAAFDQINASTASLAPAVGLLTDNIITMASIGASALSTLGVQMEQVGLVWQRTLASLSSSGTAHAAIQALVQVFAELLRLAAPLTQLGATVMAALGPALAGALRVLSVALEGLNAVLGLLPGPIQTFVVALLAMRVAMSIFGATSVVGFIAGLRLIPAAVAGATTALGALRAGLAATAAAFAINPITLAIGLLIVALGALGGAMADNSQQAADASAAQQEYADALRETGGVVTENIRLLVANNAERAGMLQTARDLGIAESEVVSAITGTNDALLAQLDAIAAANTEWVAMHDEFGTIVPQMNATGQSAADLAAKIREQQKAFDEGANSAKRVAEALGPAAEALTAAGQASASSVLQTTTWAKALETLAKDTETATAKIDAFAAAMAAASDKPRSVAVATQQANDALRELAESTIRGAGGLVSLNGTIDTFTQKGSDLQSLVLDAASGFDRLYSATLLQSGSFVQAAAAAGQYREKVVAAVQQMGVAEPQARALVNTLLAWPADVRTQITVDGAVQGLVETLGLKDAILSVPDQKSVVVKALTNEARAILQSLGIQVVNLPNGQILVTAHDATDPVVQEIIKRITGQEVPIPVTPETSGIPPAIAQAPPGEVKPPVTPDTSGIASQVGATQVPPVKVPTTVDTAGVASGLAGFVPAAIRVPTTADTQGAIDAINGIRPPPINIPVGITDNASAAITGIRNAASVEVRFSVAITDNASGAISGIRNAAAVEVRFSVAITDNASGAINGIRNAASAEVRFSVSITDNATAAINGIRNLAVTVATMPIDADTALADGKLSDLVRRVTDTTASIKVDADTSAAQAKIDALKRPTSSTHTVRIVTEGALPNAAGSIVPAGFSFFGRGGFGREMPAGKAAIVPPRTYRVIGDRSKDDEAYIPINTSSRSRALLGITAARMGYGLYPMASGGILGIDQLARLAQSLSRGSVSTQQAGAIPGPAGTGPRRGGDGASVEAKLDELIAVMRERGVTQPITVEDRSGDPVQTARAVQLALRLAR